jgi:hypothetical protein
MDAVTASLYIVERFTRDVSVDQLGDPYTKVVGIGLEGLEERSGFDIAHVEQAEEKVVPM